MKKTSEYATFILQKSDWMSNLWSFISTFNELIESNSQISDCYGFAKPPTPSVKAIISTPAAVPAIVPKTANVVFTPSTFSTSL